MSKPFETDAETERGAASQTSDAGGCAAGSAAASDDDWRDLAALERRLAAIDQATAELRSGSRVLRASEPSTPIAMMEPPNTVEIAFDAALASTALGPVEFRSEDGRPFRRLIKPEAYFLGGYAINASLRVEAHLALAANDAASSSLSLGLDGVWSPGSELMRTDEGDVIVSADFPPLDDVGGLSTAMLRVEPRFCNMIGVSRLRIVRASEPQRF